MSEYIFTFTNSLDRDKMQHYAAFHLGLHCLQKYSFRGFPNTKCEHVDKENEYHQMSTTKMVATK